MFTPGDQKTFSKIVQASEIAQFESGVVHEVYSSFCLAKDAEWCSRLFVLDLKTDDEEGIGTRITVEHCSPAFVGDTVLFITTLLQITDKKEVLTSYEAYVGKRLIAKGEQGQRILPKSKIESLFAAAKLQ
jgi:fluoroacetyl-CoA thioesterase